MLDSNLCGWKGGDFFTTGNFLCYHLGGVEFLPPLGWSKFFLLPLGWSRIILLPLGWSRMFCYHLGGVEFLLPLGWSRFFLLPLGRSRIFSIAGAVEVVTVKGV